MGERNPRLDALRGVAILAMIVDHATVLVFGVERLAWNGRAVGRLAEPLFVVLFGYFLEHRSSDLPSRSAPGALGPSDAAARRRPLGRRAAQILLAAAIVEPLFYGVFVHLDILATLLLVLLLHAALGRAFVLCAPLFLLAPWDPTAAWLNYPLFLVASQAAAGALLRTRGGLAAS
ncbi:MAG: DUF1624 domain-containing protein, partial [Myxococcales bacterium]|nr:DUF1624 domain-containing protein [Myxococcales bacterium]